MPSCAPTSAFGYRFEQDITVQLSHTEDAKEAQRVFAEKRKPVFKGALM